jgi:hypothetical protein
MTHRQPNKARLNPQLIQRLKPSDKPYMIWDTMQRGLAVRVETSGHCGYKVIYNRAGRTRWIALAACNAISLSDARVLAAEIMLQVAKGGDPAADRRAQRSAGTFADLAAKYLEVAKRKNKSWKQGDALVRKHLLPRWGKLPVDGIVRADVKAMMNRILAPVVANQTLAAASAIFSWGIKEELAKVNPCVGVERNAVKSRERILSDTELPRFWQAFDEARRLSRNRRQAWPLDRRMS